MKLRKLMFAITCSALSIYGLSSFVASDEESGGSGQLFNSPKSHANYPCPGVTVTCVIYYHNSQIISTNYSNGVITQGIAWGQSVTSQVTGTPTTYPAFNTTWIECLAELGLGCTACPPIKACTVGC
jgi:hypothetical protein